MLERIARGVVSRPRLHALLGLALLAAAVAGLLHLRADFSVRAFFSADTPERWAYDAYVERWGNDDRVALIVASTSDGTLLTPARLDALGALESDLEASPVISEVSSLLGSTWIRGEDGLLHIETVAESRPGSSLADGALEDGALKDWATLLRADTSLVPGLLSEDAATTGLAVQFAGSTSTVEAVVPQVKELREILARHAGRAEIDLGLAGIPAVRADFFTLIFRDQAVFAPLIIIICTIGLTVIFRSLHGVIAPVIGAWLPTLLTFGLMGATDEPLGIVNQTYISLLPTIAVADSIHLVSRYHEELRARGTGRPDRRTREQAVVAAVKRVGAACMLTSLTTAIGMLSLGMAQMPILRTFGLYAAAGIGSAFFVVVLIVPLSLLWSRAGPPDTSSDFAAKGDRLLLACADLAIRRPRAVLAATLLFMVTAVGLGLRVQVDNHLTGLLDPAHSTSVANRKADAALGGILSLELDLAGEPGALRHPAVLGAMDRLARDVSDFEEVRAVVGLAEPIRRLSAALGGPDAVPEDPAAIGQLLLLLEGQDSGLERLVTEDYSRGRVSIRVVDVGANAFATLAERLLERTDAAFEGAPVAVTPTGTPFVAYAGVNNVTTDLARSLGTAFVVITAVILVLLRDVRLALICLVPNALPLLAGWGMMGALGWSLDPTAGMVFTIALGIAVDDTIHLMVRWREERAEGHAHEDAIRRAVRFTGRAVGITSLLLTAGFAINVLGSFPDMRLVGVLGATVICAAFVADVLVLPALLAFAAR